MTTTFWRGLPNALETPASNFPQLLTSNQRPALAFDAATDETVYWTDVVPQGFTGTPTLYLKLAMASATSGAVGFQAQIEAITPGDSLDTDATTSFDTINNSTSTTVPGTAGYEFEISITMTTNDGMAAGDTFRIALNRDADGSAITDSASGDCYLIAAEMRY